VGRLKRMLSEAYRRLPPTRCKASGVEICLAAGYESDVSCVFGSHRGTFSFEWITTIPSR
jgi:hypothetical protein